MSYRHIENLRSNHPILMFKKVIASEKVHGTSAHVKYKVDENKLIFFSGGSNREQFIALFNQDELLEKFKQNAVEHPEANITFFGEGYGGKLQGMSHTYGKDLQFIVFECQINDQWLGHLEAERMALKFGFEFIPYKVIDCNEEALYTEMMADSEVAIRRGMGTGHMREGIVLRPLVEMTLPNGGRIIYKHKRPEFAEQAHPPKVFDADQLKILENANAIADEFVCMERLKHVFDAISLSEPKIEDANKVIKGMVDDIEREANGEIIESKEARKAIGKKTMQLFKVYLDNKTFA